MSARLLAGCMVMALYVSIGAGTAVAGDTPERRPSFTGVFELDPQASKLQVPVPSAMVFRIRHEEPKVELSRSRTIEGETDTWGITLLTDGKETVQRRGDSAVRYRMYWRGGSLVLESATEYEGNAISNVVVYSLSDGGQTLTAFERFRGPKLSYENTWVLRRTAARPSDGRR